MERTDWLTGCREYPFGGQLLLPFARRPAFKVIMAGCLLSACLNAYVFVGTNPTSTIGTVKPLEVLREYRLICSQQAHISLIGRSAVVIECVLFHHWGALPMVKRAAAILVNHRICNIHLNFPNWGPNTAKHIEQLCHLIWVTESNV